MCLGRVVEAGASRGVFARATEQQSDEHITGRFG